MSEYQPSLVEKLAEFFTMDLNQLPNEIKDLVIEEGLYWDGLSARQRAALAQIRDTSKFPQDVLLDRCGVFFSDFERFINEKLNSSSISRSEKTILYELKEFTNFAEFLKELDAPELENTSNDLQFNPSAENYPKELDFALQAWRAISTSPGKGNPKIRIKKWLDSAKTGLSPTAIKRISVVANWKKDGGASKTE